MIPRRRCWLPEAKATEAHPPRHRASSANVPGATPVRGAPSLSVTRTTSSWRRGSRACSLITLGPLLASAVPVVHRLQPAQRAGVDGLDNYRRMFGDPRFYHALKVTFIYVGVSVPLQLAFALALAVVLDRGIRGLALYRSIYYLPSLLGGSVAVAVLWRQIFGTERPGERGFSGISASTTCPAGSPIPGYALGTLIILNVWTFGSPMVIFLAGLRQIPRTCYEAAAVDGAGRIRRFFRITLPLLTPIIFFNLVLQLIHAFQSFTQAFIVSGGDRRSGRLDALLHALPLPAGLRQLRHGLRGGARLGAVLIVAVLTAVNFLASRFWVFYGDDSKRRARRSRPPPACSAHAGLILFGARACSTR